MPDFKVRRKLLAAGGVDITGTASFSGGIAAGSAGQAFNDLLFGSGCINCPSAVADAVVVGTGSLTSNYSQADPIFLTPVASLPAGMVLIGACCISGCVSASWINSTSDNITASANVTCSYLIFS